MKRMLIGIGAAALLMGMPASAQYPGYGGYRAAPVQRQLDRLDVRIDEGVARGAIAPGEAVRLRDELARLSRLRGLYARGGLDANERAAYRRQLVLLRDRIRFAERGLPAPAYDDPYHAPARPGGYGADPYDFQPGDDSDHDRDGRWDDDRWYDPADDVDDYGAERAPGSDWPRTERWDDDDRGGDAWDGRGGDAWQDEDWYADGPDFAGAAPPAEPGGSIVMPSERLRVGDRAPVNLSPVPPGYRDLYRDGEGVYYRYDNGRVFQIEQGSNRIRWIGALPY